MFRDNAVAGPGLDPIEFSPPAILAANKKFFPCPSESPEPGGGISPVAMNRSNKNDWEVELTAFF